MCNEVGVVAFELLAFPTGEPRLALTPLNQDLGEIPIVTDGRHEPASRATDTALIDLVKGIECVHDAAGRVLGDELLGGVSSDASAVKPLDELGVARAPLDDGGSVGCRGRGRPSQATDASAAARRRSATAHCPGEEVAEVHRRERVVVAGARFRREDAGGLGQLSIATAPIGQRGEGAPTGLASQVRRRVARPGLGRVAADGLVRARDQEGDPLLGVEGVVIGDEPLEIRDEAVEHESGRELVARRQLEERAARMFLWDSGSRSRSASAATRLSTVAKSRVGLRRRHLASASSAMPR